MRPGALAAGVAVWVAACAPNPYRAPAQVRDYEMLIPGRDTLARALAVAFQEAGFRVRQQPRGGGPPPATVVFFEFSPREGGPDRLAGRVYNVRSGRLLAAATLSLDATPPGAAERARLLVAALLAEPDSAPPGTLPRFPD